jgi:hypothetical protein
VLFVVNIDVIVVCQVTVDVYSVNETETDQEREDTYALAVPWTSWTRSPGRTSIRDPQISLTWVPKQYQVSTVGLKRFECITLDKRTEMKWHGRSRSCETFKCGKKAVKYPYIVVGSRSLRFGLLYSWKRLLEFRAISEVFWSKQSNRVAFEQYYVLLDLDFDRLWLRFLHNFGTF